MLALNADLLTNPLFAFGSVLVLGTFYLVWNWRAAEDRASAPSIVAWNRKSGDIKSKAAAYTAVHAVAGGTKEDRINHAQDVTNHYYDSATDAYLWGWGECFHFAPRYSHESFNESIVRHEWFLASQLNARPGQRLLDIGCGVGGPMRNIARFLNHCRITGLNNNAYQLVRLAAMNKKAGLADRCEGIKGDFMAMPFKDESFDNAYAIEATCHAPDRVGCFSEVLRILKPGGRFCCYEWAVTKKYDPSNAHHVELKEGIELGNSLPDVNTIEDITKCMADAGFEIEEVRDVAEDTVVPWYEPFQPKYTPSGFKTTMLGIKLTNLAVRAMEVVRIAPAGSAKMHSNLSVGAMTLYHAGLEGIFTPMLLMVGRKPL